MSDGEYLARDRSLLDVRGLAIALLRGWRFVGALAVLGGVAGGLVTPVISPTYEASAALLLARVPGDDVNPTSAMTTEAQVAASLRVAGGAARRLGAEEPGRPAMPAEKLLKRYRVTIKTDHVLEITASGRSAPEAVARARAVAASFLAFRRSQLDRSLDQATTTLAERRQGLEAEVATLTGRINELSRAVAAQTRSTDPVTVRELEAALTRRDERNNEIATLGTRMADATLEAAQASTASRVLDAPVLPDAPVSPKLVFDVAAGLLLGLALAVAVVVTGEVVGVRARWRQDVAAAAGAPVLVEVPWAGARPGRRRRRRGRGVDRAALRRAGQLLGRAVAHGAPAAPAGTLALVSLGADRVTAELAVVASDAVAATGTPSVLVEVRGQRSVLARRRAPRPQAAPIVTLGPDDEATVGRDTYVVALSNTDARAHWTRLAAIADTAALVAVAGDVSEVALQGAARDLAALGVPVRFVVLVGPDRLDQTSGRGVASDGLGPSPLLPVPTGVAPPGEADGVLPWAQDDLVPPPLVAVPR